MYILQIKRIAVKMKAIGCRWTVIDTNLLALDLVI